VECVWVSESSDTVFPEHSSRSKLVGPCLTSSVVPLFVSCTVRLGSGPCNMCHYVCLNVSCLVFASEATAEKTELQGVSNR
jgi:hypothetical protein